MVLAVLIGNSRAVAAWMKGTLVLRRLIVPTDFLRRGPSALAWAAKLRGMGAGGMIVASVVPTVDPFLRKAVRKTFGIAPQFVTHQTKLGIKVKVKKPAQVGADRLANAVAANKFYGAPSIVVDYGTGTTFDVLDQGGAYCGGAILPGIGISLRALHDFTAKIPKVEFKRVP